MIKKRRKDGRQRRKFSFKQEFCDYLSPRILYFILLKNSNKEETKLNMKKKTSKKRKLHTNFHTFWLIVYDYIRLLVDPWQIVNWKWNENGPKLANSSRLVYVKYDLFWGFVLSSSRYIHRFIVLPRCFLCTMNFEVPANFIQKLIGFFMIFYVLSTYVFWRKQNGQIVYIYSK